MLASVNMLKEYFSEYAHTLLICTQLTHLYFMWDIKLNPTVHIAEVIRGKIYQTCVYELALHLDCYNSRQ